MTKTRKFKKTKIVALVVVLLAIFVVATLFVTSGCSKGEDGNCCTTSTAHNHVYMHNCYDCDTATGAHLENGKHGLCGEPVCVCRQTIACLVYNCPTCEQQTPPQNGKYGLCGKNPCVCRQTIVCCR